MKLAIRGSWKHIQNFHTWITFCNSWAQIWHVRLQLVWCKSKWRSPRCSINCTCRIEGRRYCIGGHGKTYNNDTSWGVSHTRSYRRTRGTTSVCSYRVNWVCHNNCKFSINWICYINYNINNIPRRRW
jgi:hypothetical protein